MQLLDEENILCTAHFAAREEVYSFVARALCGQGRAQGENALVESFHARDALFTTYMDDGVAIPHCISPCVQHATVFFLHNRQPLLWDEDSNEATLIFPLAVPADSPPEAHLRTLAMLAQNLMDSAQISHLRRCQSPREVLQALDFINTQPEGANP